jgi:hypothetical protein
MLQTRLGSLIEALFNVAIGISVAILSQMAIFPMFDIQVTFATHASIGAWFTAISVVRSYIVRRWFNERLRKMASMLSHGK